MTEPLRYNLVEEPWIHALTRRGQLEWLSLAEAFRRAHEIHSFAYANPMDRFAVFRLMQAILYWLEGNPTPEKKAQPRELFERVAAALEAQRNYFDLWGAEKRFYQLRPLKGEEALPSSVTRLFHEIPSGMNIAHFRHVWEEELGVCEPCATLGLLRMPPFTTQGGAGFSPGISGKPPIFGLEWGRELASSLLTNWVIREPLGVPSWIDPELPTDGRAEIPLLTGLTWFARRVWLSPPEESTSHCMLCGRRSRLVRHCHFEGGRKSQGDWPDPLAVAESAPASEAPAKIRRSPNALASAHSFAREAPGILLRLGKDFQSGVWICSLVSDQAKFIHLTDISAPAGLNVSTAGESLISEELASKALLKTRHFDLSHAVVRSTEKQRAKLPKALESYVKNHVVPSGAQALCDMIVKRRRELTEEDARQRLHQMLVERSLSSFPAPQGPAWPRLRMRWRAKIASSFAKSTNPKKGGST